ncbi:unnamed protein product [Closterium sp. NIES-64]|nr:unnamed protein product [Closterium sp. NIES-64]
MCVRRSSRGCRGWGSKGCTGRGNGGVGEGAAEVAEERAAEAAREGAAAGEAAADAAGEAARAAACKVGQTLAGEAAQSTAGEVAGTAIGEAAGTAAGEAAGTTADEAAGGTRAGTAAGEAAGTAAREAAGTAAGKAAGTAAGEAEQITAGATGEGEVSVVPTGVGTEEGDVIAIEKDEGEDVMHIDGPLAQYLTPDGEADPAPLQPHVEVPPLPPMPVHMLAEGPMEGLGETLRTEPHEGAPILTSRPPAHPPPGAPFPHPHPQVPVVSRGAAKALAFLAEPCSPTPTLLHGQPPSPSPTPDPTVAGGPPGEHAAETHPQGLAPQAHGSGGTRVEGPTGEATTEPTQTPLPPPFARTTGLAAGGRTGAEEAEGPTATARPPNPHSRPAPTPPQGHGSGPAHSPPFCPSLAVSPSQVAAAAIATGMEAVGLRDAPMEDATDSPSHPSHPFHVDDPLPQPMVIGEGQGGLLGQGPHPSSAQPASPTPPSTLPALLLSPTGRQVFETPEEVRAGISDLLAIHRPSSSPAAPTLPVPQDRTRTYAEVTRSVPSFIPPATQPGASLPTPMETDREVTSSRDEASAPTETPPPGVAEPSLEPHPAEGQEHTTSSPPLIPGDPLGAQAAHGVPSTASSDAMAPIDPADTATSPDQVTRLAGRRLPMIPPRSSLPSHSPVQTGIQFTDAQWQTLDSVDWTEYFSPERIHARPLRRVPERVRGGYLNVLSAILVRIAQDPEAAGPTFLLAAAPTLFLVPATPPDPLAHGCHCNAHLPLWSRSGTGVVTMHSERALARETLSAPSWTWACCEDVREAALDQIFLPIRLGGFGIRRMARIAPSFASGASRLLEAQALEAVRARHASPLHLARLTSLQGGGAGAWLTSVPYADPLRIPEALWQAASSSRLGLPIPQVSPCRSVLLRTGD